MARLKSTDKKRKVLSLILLLLSVASATVPEIVVLLHYFPLVRGESKLSLYAGTVCVIIMILSVVLSSIMKSRLSKVLPWTISPLIFFVCGAALLSVLERIIHEMSLVMIAGAAGMLGATVFDVASMLCRPDKPDKEEK